MTFTKSFLKLYRLHSRSWLQEIIKKTSISACESTEMNKKIIKILLCDDNDNFRQLLTQYINAMPGVEIVGEAVDGVDAIDKTETLDPDLVLMDLSMPNQSGLDATKTIKEKWPEKSVIILTLYEDSVYKAPANEFNADCFIAKSSIKTQLPILIQTRLRNNNKNMNAYL